MMIIGIDPGLSGGIALLDGDEVQACHMPVTDRDLFMVLMRWCDAKVAYVEKVHAGPKMGSSAAWKFGRNCGAIVMACIGAGIRIEQVSPQKWQRAMGLLVQGRGLGQNDTAKKNRNKAKAQELFGHTKVKITHHTSDALLIAEYGRRQEALLNGTGD